MASTPNASSALRGYSASGSSPSDPLSKSKRTSTPASRPDDKSEEVKKEVNKVVGIMQTNIGKVVERGDKLDHLQSQADELQTGALQFCKNATEVRKKLWWKNVKLNVAIAVIVLVIIAAIALTIWSQTDKNNDSKDSKDNKP